INGAGGSTDRLLSVGTFGAIESSGTGAVNFTNTGAIGRSGTVAGTLALTGSNTGDNTFTPVIVDGVAATNLQKTGSGTWIIPTANSYTGNTTINTGLLRITNGNALGANGTGSVNIVGNTGGNGILELSGGISVTKNFRFEARQLGTADIPHIRSAAGNNVINGTVTAGLGGSEYNIESAAAGSTLTLNGNIELSTVSGGIRNLKLMGAGDGVLNGNFIGAGGSGVTSLTKQGGGKWTVNGAAGHNGATLIQGGTLALSATGSLPTTNAIQISTGATLDVTAPGGLTMNAGSTLGGYGTVLGAVTSSGGAIISPGTLSAPGTLTINGNLSLIGGETLALNFGSATTPGGGVNDLIDVNGTLTTAGTTTIAFHPIGATVGGTYRALEYDAAGTLGGTFDVLNSSRYNVVVSTATAGQVNLTVSGNAADLTWSGTVDGTWDTNLTQNWNAGAEKFFEADRVTFNDTSTVNQINIVDTVLPGGMTVDTDLEYTFSGGALGGGGDITKNGSGTLVLNAANTFDGDVVANEGMVRIGNATALGSTVGGVTINEDAALDVNGLTTPVGEVVTISGSGVGALGAVVNNGAVAGGLKKLVLAGDATLGGFTRWDIRDVPGGLDGAGHALTKVGSNEIYLKDLGETHLGGVVVSEGTLGFEGNTTFGDGAGVVEVEAQGRLSFYNYTATNTKSVDLQGGTLLTPAGAGAANVVTSPILLSGDSTADIAASTTLSLRGVISGTGGLTKATAGTLELGGTVANTFTGVTTVNEGNLRLAKPAGTNAIGGDLVLIGGSVTFGNGEQIPDTATVSNLSGGILVLSNETVANVVVTTSGTGEVQATNGVNVTDTLTINNGVYSQASNSAGAVGEVSMFTGGILRIAANSGNSTLDVGAGGITALGGEIQVGHGVGEWDAVLNLNGNITAMGDLLINNGNYAGEKLRQVNLTGARTIDVAEVTTTTVHADFGGEGSLTKTGEGTLLLTERSASTYTGPTSVNEGAVLVSGSLSGGDVTVAAAATLGGNGTINGNVVVNGALLPGITTGTLTLGNSNLTLGSAATTTFELGLGSFDRITGINNLTLDGSVQISLFEGFVPLGGETFDLLDFTTINADGFNVAADLVLPALGAGLSWDTTQFLTAGTLAVVPEPTTAGMLLMGIGFLGARRRRKVC
ncbi:MAG: autotransporter-associated beta strand repeat-containing protein, partial [Chthoniobacteraceae bacterium]